MPKGEKKTVPKKKERRDSNGSVPKKKCLKPNPEDNISKSKKLTEKLKNTKPTARRSGRSSTCQDESRICGNGKPMPSLADLEKMFEDSDDDDEHKIGTPKKSKLSENISQTTPEKPVIITEDKLTSPGTIKKIADKMMNLISNLPEPILVDEGPPPPIIPPKKRKKPEVPYIVGCKERPQVPHKPSVNFCKGDDYGIEKNTGGDDDECPKKRAKRTKAVNLSKSIFNAKSDDIAAWLKDIDKAEQSDGSSDSNKTVEYELGAGPRSFSPLPSTSKDNETISQNDKKFIDSLVNETISEDSRHSVYTIEDKTNATIVIDDDDIIINEQNKNTNDCVEVIEVNDTKCYINTDKKCENSKIIIDDEYDDCYKFVYTDVPDADIPEIIDVDAVIAENQAIIEKYSKVEQLNSVTHVDSNSIYVLDDNETVNSTSQLDITENFGNALIDSNATNKGTPPLNSTGNQIQRIVNSYFHNNSKENNVHSKYHPNSDLNMLKSRFENTHCDLFANFTSWIKLVQSVQSKSRIQNTHANNTHANDEVIEIDDNYFPTVNVSNHVPSRKRRKTRLPNTLPHNQRTSQNSTQKTCCPWNCDHLNRIGNRQENQFIPGNQPVVSNWPTQNRTFVQNRVPDQYNNMIVQPTHVQIQPVQPPPVQPPPVQPPPVQPPPVQPSSTSSPIRKGIGDCPICMDNLANTLAASTTCGHVFCMACIKAAVKASGKRCPTCRKVLKGVGFHQLFL